MFHRIIKKVVEKINDEYFGGSNATNVSLVNEKNHLLKWSFSDLEGSGKNPDFGFLPLPSKVWIFLRSHFITNAPLVS